MARLDAGDTIIPDSGDTVGQGSGTWLKGHIQKIPKAGVSHRRWMGRRKAPQPWMTTAWTHSTQYNSTGHQMAKVAERAMYEKNLEHLRQPTREGQGLALGYVQ